MDSISTAFIAQMCFGLIGGLGIFLLGMKNMSEGMQAVAGSKLRKLISMATENRMMACGVGTLVTAMIQSSSITTVMVVGFVSAGFMTLIQAIGVIMGANIGTTITGWILVLNIGKYGLPLLGISAFLFLFSRNERVRYIGMTLMGVGMVFYGLQLMSSGFRPMRSMPQFIEWFSRFQADTYFGVWKCVLTGCVWTAVVQSSSATLGITMGLASSGIINFESAAALVLGENIGTTITAFFASMGAGNQNAKRAAYSHIIFNIIGVLWITSIFGPYTRFISSIIGVDPGMMIQEMGEPTFPFVIKGIALVHSIFNITNTLIFLPFIPLLAKIVTKLAPDQPEKEISHLKYLDIRLINAPAIGIQQSQSEIGKMGRHVLRMFELLREIMASREIDDEKVKKVFFKEEVLDSVQKEITEYLAHLLSGNISRETAAIARRQLRLADEYESISDYLKTILKLYLKKKDNLIVFSDEGWHEILDLHDKTFEYIKTIFAATAQNNTEIILKAETMGDAITHAMKNSRSKHLERIGSDCATPLATLIFTDMLNAYRRVKDHGMNIAEVLAGEK